MKDAPTPPHQNPQWTPPNSSFAVKSVEDLSPQAQGELQQMMQANLLLQQAQGKLSADHLVGYPGDATKALLGDGTWGTTAVAPTHLPGMGSGGVSMTVAANTAYLMPIGNLTVPTTITRITWGLITVVAGNYDVGVYYSDDESTFTRLVSKGSTAQPAAGTIITSVASTTLTPVVGRRFYYALALSTGSNVSGAASGTAQSGGIPGYTKATSFALPSSLSSMTAIGAAPLPVLHGAV